MDRGREADALLGQERDSHPPSCSGATSIWTKFVSVRSGSTASPALGEPAREPLRAAVVVGQPVDVVVERVDPRRRRRYPAWRMAPPKRCFMRRAFPITSIAPARMAPSGQPSPFERQSVTASKRPPISAASIPVADRRRSAAARRRGGSGGRARAPTAQLADLLERPDPSAARVVRVLDPDDARARRVVRRRAEAARTWSAP